MSFSDYILFEDNHLLVVNKPANLLVQGDATGDVTLLDQAKFYLKEKYNKPGNVYLGLVHRLDRPASGVIVLARTSKAAERLSTQFQSRKTKKVYRIIVRGKPPKFGEWKDFIHRKGATSVISDENQGKPASLDFSRLKTSPGFSLVEVRLHTGRHHQIRVQFASRKFPVSGDFRYGSKEKFPDRAIALHAFSLTLIHPTTKESMIFTADLPASWNDFLADMT